MANATSLDDPWFDIVAPAPPDSDLLFWGLIALSCLLSAALIAQFIWKRRPRQVLRRQVNGLLHTHAIQPKQRLRMLEQSICRFYHTTLLTEVPLVDPSWLDFVTRLQRACYHSDSVKHHQARELILQAKALLKRLHR